MGMKYTTLHKLDHNITSPAASWSGIPRGSLYAASKHAILGLMRSLYPGFQFQNIRIASIHPFFAGKPPQKNSLKMVIELCIIDTAIVPIPLKLLLSGIPLTPVPRIAGAILYAATDPSPETNGSAWLLTDDGPVFMVPKEEFKMGVYKMIDDRANAMIK